MIEILAITVPSAITCVLVLITAFYAAQTKQVANKTAELVITTEKMMEETAKLVEITHQATFMPGVGIEGVRLMSEDRLRFVVRNIGRVPFLVATIRAMPEGYKPTAFTYNKHLAAGEEVIVENIKVHGIEKVPQEPLRIPVYLDVKDISGREYPYHVGDTFKSGR